MAEAVKNGIFFFRRREVRRDGVALDPQAVLEGTL